MKRKREKEELERKNREVVLDLVMERKREELLLQAKRKELDHQRKESDLRKYKSALLDSQPSSSLVADVERDLGAGSCKSKVLTYKPMTANEAYRKGSVAKRTEATCSGILWFLDGT
jgi:hypothetical protein